MGQKVNPLGIRLGITRDWVSKWYAGKKQFPDQIHTDFRVREFLQARSWPTPRSAACTSSAPPRKVNVTIQTARPGIVIGKKGEDIEKLRAETAKLLGMPVERRAPERRRDPQAGARRAAGRRRHRAADREARDVPPRHEARRDEHDAQRRAGREGAPVGPPERLGNRAHGDRPAKAACRCTRSAPTSTTACRSPHHLRRDRRQGLDLQGRSVRQGRAGSRSKRPPQARRPAATPLPPQPQPATA